MIEDMNSAQKALIRTTSVLLVAFTAFGVYTWARVLQAIPISLSCATELAQISQQSAKVRPFFLGAFVACAAIFEFSRRQMSKGWRLGYLVTLGLGAALLVAPWLVDLFSRD